MYETKSVVRLRWVRAESWMQLRLRRLRLTIGLRRLRRWKSLLLSALKAIRLDLAPGAQPPEHRILQTLRLPQELLLSDQTLQWALATLEDLFLLVQEQESQTESLLSTLKPS